MIITGMGTKIEYAVNILEASQNSNSFTVHCVDDWEHLQNKGVKGNFFRSSSSTTGVDNFVEDSMEKKLGKHNIEYIKRTMQMHEDVFKCQVRELHRLYSLQKMLMDELKKELKQNRCRSSMSNTHFNKPHHNFNLQSLREDPSPWERSGCYSGSDTMRMARGFDLERPADEQEDISTRSISAAIDEDQAAGPSFYNIPPTSHKLSINDGSDEDSDVELTLSIGGSLTKKALQSYQPKPGIFCESSQKGIIRGLDSSASFKSDHGEDFSDPTTPMSSSSATFDQERNRPHRLFQGLKL